MQNDDVFSLSYAHVDISPHLSASQPIKLFGVPGPDRMATGIHSPLLMQFALLQDAQKNRALFISCDLYGFSPLQLNPVYQSAGQAGVPPEAVFINSSGNVNAPGVMPGQLPLKGGYYPDYAQQVITMMGQIIPELANRLEQGKLFSGFVETRIGANDLTSTHEGYQTGLDPCGYLERNTPYLCFESSQSPLRLIMVNHGCKPVGMSQQGLVSAGFPGALRQSLIAGDAFNQAMFLQGAAGDVAEVFWTSSGISPASGPDQIQANGGTIAQAVLSSYAAGKEPVQGPIRAVKQECLLPLNRLGYQFNWEKVPSGQRQIMQPGLQFIEANGSKGMAEAVPGWLQSMSFGGKHFFISMPFEPAALLARRLRWLFDEPDKVMVMGNTGGQNAAVPDVSQARAGGVGIGLKAIVDALPGVFSSQAPQELEAAAVICQKRLGVGRDLDKQRPSPGSSGGHPGNFTNNLPAFFVLSTGRCGTMTLASLLNTADNAMVWHEAMPTIIIEKLWAYHNELDKTKMYLKAREHLLFDAYQKGLIYGEADNALTFFADALAELLPKAKFLILIRDPRYFVRSGMNRGYYLGHVYDSGRIRPKENDPQFEQWSRMDQFGKVAWQWKETYRWALDFASRQPRERVKTIKFEDLVKDPDVTADLFSFLGLKSFDRKKVMPILKKPLNKQVGGGFIPVNEWPDVYHARLWSDVGEMGPRLGYRPDKIKSSAS
jgi:hypothetical protein